MKSVYTMHSTLVHTATYNAEQTRPTCTRGGGGGGGVFDVVY